MENYFEVDIKLGYFFYQSNDDFKICQVSQSDVKFNSNDMDNKNLKRITVRGYFPNIESGDLVHGICCWNFSKKHGWSLDVQSCRVVFPSNSDGIAKFLVRFCRGVGKQTATTIVKTLGEQTIDKIMEDYTCLLSVKGIGEKTAQRIHKAVLKNKGIEQLSVFLFSHGITNYNDILTIYEKIGELALDKIKQNPYVLCMKIGANMFPLADAIALSIGIEPDSETRLYRLMEFYLMQETSIGGNMYIPYAELRTGLRKFISDKHLRQTCLIDIENKTIFDNVLYSMISENTIVIEDNDVYPHWSYTNEVETAKLVKEMLAPTIPLQHNQFPKFLQEYEESCGLQLDEKQQIATKNAYEYRFSLITGGAGTGKTQTIKSILAYLRYVRPNAIISLIAPTGRASKRMSEVTGEYAETIHRFIGLRAGEYISTVEIESDYVICDEGSMIDARLFYALLKAVSEAGASLIIVGDIDQLPPVNAGFPFRDLVLSEQVPTTRLTTLFRTSEQNLINVNAKLILAGNPNLINPPERNDFKFFFIQEPMVIRDYMLTCIQALMHGGVSEDDIVVLSPMRKSLLGVLELNIMLQAFFNPQDELSPSFKTHLYRIYEGDRVMQTVNDGELNVFNGDIGKVICINNEDGEVEVEFDDFENENGVIRPCKRSVIYDEVLAKDLILAYAMTVHKAQGCEYPVVLMPIHSTLVNCNRNLLYTAFTRAKQHCVMIGDYYALKTAVGRVDAVKRRSSLVKRICQIEETL